MAEVATSTDAGVLVIAIAGGSGQVIRDLTAEAERCGLVPKVIPSVRELLTGRAQVEGVRDPRISDLLGRRAVTTDVASVRDHIAGKRVLVTGTEGSIGAELCHQLHQLRPAELIMLDRDKSALRAIQLALHGCACLTLRRPPWLTSGISAGSERCSRDSGPRSSISTDKFANPVSVLGYSKRITGRFTVHMSA